MKELNDLLTEGLKTGYAGGVTPQTVERGQFTVKSMTVPVQDGKYIDEWTSLGGQEIAEMDGKRIIRVYAGRVIGEDELAKLGITTQDVIAYLKKKNTELAGLTRLDEDCLPDPDGDWQYGYSIIQRVPEVGLVGGLETINYKENLVFSHLFAKSSD